MKEERNFFADSSFLIDLFRGKKKAVEKLKEADRVISSVLCLYELDKLVQFDSCKLERNELVEVRIEDSKKASEFYRSLKDRGKMISQIDILIAAQAFNRGYSVVTRDDHFDRIGEIEVENY